MGRDTDFERLAERIRTHSIEASGSNTGRVTMRDLDEVSHESLRELLDALDADPGTRVFYLSPANADRVLAGTDADDVDDLSECLGRDLRVEESMPDDTVLLMDPDAIDGGEVADPGAVVCGTVGDRT
ncbi:hypothetical protein [Halalkalicoccus sp. NIPERK01]|uniref:hypothetical protein n=1 Tax=Halalkalicoccus sp. NIPERK01 TaxID=3053469 RepID=UPI00256EFD0F|nr:hypothetical protein [Halalkalicoccus sp. NIPERK01]MDL5361813.1 hypothetical protein [Halalkalicoccus sp. NIPERK01]